MTTINLNGQPSMSLQQYQQQQAGTAPGLTDEQNAWVNGGYQGAMPSITSDQQNYLNNGGSFNIGNYAYTANMQGGSNQDGGYTQGTPNGWAAYNAPGGMGTVNALTMPKGTDYWVNGVKQQTTGGDYGAWTKVGDAATMAILAAATGYAGAGAMGAISAGGSLGAGTAATSAADTAGGMSGMDLAADGALSGGNALNSAAMTDALASGGAGASGLSSLTGGSTPSWSSLGSALSKAVASSGSGGSGSGGSVLGSLTGLAAGKYAQNQQNAASDQMLAYLKQRQAINDNMYAPGSPEYNALWNQMSAQDAAAGRNSQYGTRSVDLAAKIAGLKMNANTQLTGQIAKDYMSALNNKSNAAANITGPLGQLSGTSSSGLGNLLQQMQANGYNDGTGSVDTGPDTSWMYNPNATTYSDGSVQNALNNIPGYDPSADWSM